MSVNKSPRKIFDWIKYQNIKECTINNSALKGLRRINKKFSIFIKISILTLGYYFTTKIIKDHIEDVFFKRIKNLEKSIKSLSEDEKKIAYLTNHIKMSIEYGNEKEMNIIEENTGIRYYREKLISNASGLVLETCCGSFRNKNFFPSQILALDWCKDALVYALANSRDDTKFVVMDCTELEYQDESFDTVVDTFGLQATHNYQKQYEEMKRVCKKGGKILLLEMGESLWMSSNYKIMKNSPKEFDERGQHLYRNWDHIILKDKSVKVIKNKRKMNGSLYYYVLEKLD